MMIAQNHSQMAESRIAAALIGRPDCAHLAAKIDPAVMHSPTMRLAVELAREQIEQDGTVDPVRLVCDMQAAGIAPGNINDLSDRINELMDIALPGWVERDIRILKEQHRAATLAAAADKVARQVGTAMSTSEAVAMMQSTLDALGEHADDATTLASVLDADDDEAHTRCTGLEWIDSAFGGFAPADKVVLSGEPGSGKSSLATQITLTMLELHADLTAVVALTEETPRQWVNRAMSQVAGMPMSLLRHPASPQQATTKQRAIDELRELGKRLTFITDPSPATVGAAIAGPCIVLVDFLQQVRPNREHANRRDGIDSVISDLTRIGQRTGAIQLWLSNLAKPQTAGRRTILTAAKESSEVSYAADLFLIAEHIDDAGRVIDNDDDGDGRVRWACLKNRRGARRDLLTRFEGHSMTFTSEGLA